MASTHTQSASRARRTQIDPRTQSGVLITGSNHGIRPPVVQAGARHTPPSATVPTPSLEMHCSPFSLLLVQNWTSRAMFARSYQRALELLNNYRETVNYARFRPAPHPDPYSRSVINVARANIHHWGIARDIKQVRSRSFVRRRSCRHSSLVPPFLIPISVTCRSLDIALTAACDQPAYQTPFSQSLATPRPDAISSARPPISAVL